MPKFQEAPGKYDFPASLDVLAKPQAVTSS